MAKDSQPLGISDEYSRASWEREPSGSLGAIARAGHSVRVAAAWSWSHAGWSKYCRGCFSSVAPQESTAGFVQAIICEVRRGTGSIVRPMTEAIALSLSKHRAEIFEAGGKLERALHATVLQAFDKLHTTVLGNLLRMTVPRTVARFKNRFCAVAHLVQ